MSTGKSPNSLKTIQIRLLIASPLIPDQIARNVLINTFIAI